MSNLPAPPDPLPSDPRDKIRFRPSPRRGQITIVEMVTWIGPEHTYAAEPARFVRHLSSDEEPYAHKIAVGEEGTELELGWIKQPGMIFIQNLEGQHFQVIPTEEERKAVEKKVVLLWFDGDSGSWAVRPGESFRGSPGYARKIMMRCLSGIARCQLTVFPE